MIRRFAIAALGLLAGLAMLASMPSAAVAADLTAGHVSSQPLRCQGLHHVYPDEMRPQLETAVQSYHDQAVTIVEADATSVLPALRVTWADETKSWCGVSSGYFKTGYYDNEAVNRCICAFGYMRRY